MNQKTWKVTTAGMLCALAYLAVFIVRIPLILFLEYEPKDVADGGGNAFVELPHYSDLYVSERSGGQIAFAGLSAF